MNIEQAKAIALVQILDVLSQKPVKERGMDKWYLSPWRDERTASFKIDTGKNLWFDHGEGIGGDVISFVRTFLKCNNENHTISDALRWLGNMSGRYPMINRVEKTKHHNDDKLLSISDITTIKHPMLIQYLEKRGISRIVAQKHLKQIRIYNKQSKRSFFTLGFANEENGYEIRNPYFKGCLGKKAITFVRGDKPKPNGIHLFEGFMDLLSALEYLNLKSFHHDAIVLNSLSCLQSVTPYISNYGYRIAYSWMDNDKAGMKAVKALDEYFKTQDDLNHRPMNGLYQQYKDVNEWHTNTLVAPS